jgi:cytochrome c553
MLVPAGYMALGGWAVVTVENPPEHLVVGTPYEIEYSVRQHGVDLLNGLSGKVEAKLGDRIVRADAKSIASGKYRASIVVPSAGAWTVTVHSGFGPSKTTMLPVNAAAAGAPVVAMAEPERGKHLFVAKGCTTCHVDMKVIPVDVRTNRYDGQFVKKLLADPKAMPKRHSVDVEMPNLNLSATEIAALSAYLAGPNSTGTR